MRKAASGWAAAGGVAGCCVCAVGAVPGMTIASRAPMMAPAGARRVAQIGHAESRAVVARLNGMVRPRSRPAGQPAVMVSYI